MDLKTGWQFLVFQQFYGDTDIIYTRSKGVKCQIKDSNLVITAILNRLYELTWLWNDDIEKFIDAYCQLLKIHKPDVIEDLTSKFKIDPLEIKSWLDFGFEEKQVYMFTISMIWEKFIEKLVNQAYSNIDFSKWDQSEAKSLLATDYSLLKNLLYLRELSHFTQIKLDGLDDVIAKLQYNFEVKNTLNYEKIEVEVSLNQDLT